MLGWPGFAWLMNMEARHDVLQRSQSFAARRARIGTIVTPAPETPRTARAARDTMHDAAGIIYVRKTAEHDIANRVWGPASLRLVALARRRSTMRKLPKDLPPLEGFAKPKREGEVALRRESSVSRRPPDLGTIAKKGTWRYSFR